MPPVVDLTTPRGLIEAIDAYAARKPLPDEPAAPGSILGAYDGTFCSSSRCQAVRRMELRAVYNVEPLLPNRREAAQKTHDSMVKMLGGPMPRTPLWYATEGLALLCAVCLQCTHRLDLVLHSSDEDRVVVFGVGAAAGPGTPESVAYFLDQAERSRSQGAFSAAAVMYRSALEQLLRDQGFGKGTLAARIESVAEAKPEWLRMLDVEFMTALRRLANGAVHAGDEDVAARLAVDQQQVADMRAIFPGLLHAIYAEPLARAEHLRRLQESSGHR